ERSLEQELDLLLKKGFTRVVVGTETVQIEDLISFGAKLEDVRILIDRAVVSFEEDGQPREDTQFRLGDSVQTAFFEGHGSCEVMIVQDGGPESFHFSDKFERDGILFEEPSINLFTFN